MRVLIVCAHPEPTSFNGAMTRQATAALVEAGNEVIVSDLYEMGFDPVSDRRNFVTMKDPVRYDQQTEEAYAYGHGGFAPELQAEMDKLLWCDALILQFPLWWFGLPAILRAGSIASSRWALPMAAADGLTAVFLPASEPCAR